MSKYSPEPEIFLPGAQLPESVTFVRAFNDPASPTIAEVREAEAVVRMTRSQKEWESEGGFHYRYNPHGPSSTESEEDIEKRLLQDIEDISAEMKNPSVISVDEKTEIILPNVSFYRVFKF